MSKTSQARRPKVPSPESGRPRLRGKIVLPPPLSITALQAYHHRLSRKTIKLGTSGAFGKTGKAAKAHRELYLRPKAAA